MTENEYNSRYDFLCEKRLHLTDEDLHRRFRDSVFTMDLLLANYKTIFPFFTDHTFDHSEQVINYCNVIAGEDVVAQLNPDELYILLMGASLHDIGMGISQADFEEFSVNIPELSAYLKANPGLPLGEYTREFHQELSAQFIKKYAGLFDIPSEEYVYCIAQVTRGHRKADLLDEEQYSPHFLMPNGRTVNLAYIAALVKLADELDITADRNLFFDYNNINDEWSEKQKMCYKCHGALKKLGIKSDSLVLYYKTDEQAVENEILCTRSKIERVFNEYCIIVAVRTPFKNRLKNILFEKMA